MFRDKSVSVNSNRDRFLLSSMLACPGVPLLLLEYLLLAYAFVYLLLAFETVPFPDGMSAATYSALHIR